MTVGLKNPLKSKTLRFIFKLIISCSLLIHIFRDFSLDLSKLELTIYGLFLLALAFLLNLANAYLSALRLKAITPYNFSVFYAFKITLIGIFFNNFFPTNFGGDIIKAGIFKDKAGDMAHAAGYIFLDRVIGLSTLLLIAVLGLSYFAYLGEYFPLFAYLIVALFLIALTVLSLLVYFSPSLAKLLSKYPKLISLGRLRKVMQKSNLPLALFYGLIFQLNTGFVIYILSLFLGLNISLQYFIVLIPVSNLLLTIPITFNGLGVRDYIFLNFFEPFAGAGSNLLLLAPLNFALNLANAVFGAIFYLLNKKGIELSQKEVKVSDLP
ncbi:MAG: lysylphosphatidylglycerol synthase transmembrane domain-containing protein [Candidatus Dojkabacteria bacterium]